jgi:hypothetical protein
MRQHAGTVLFVGWYLLTPPLTRDSPPSTDLRAPLSHWDAVGYETGSDCEDARRDFKALYEEALIFSAICVPSADPRLQLDEDHE